MPLKPFWIKKFHTKLSDQELARLLGFKYYAGHSSDGSSSLATIAMQNAQNDSDIVLNFNKVNGKLYCTNVAGTGWTLGANYSIPITNEEAQTLLSTGTLTQSIDYDEEQAVLSPVVVKNFFGFYGSLHTIPGKSYCCGVVYEPTLTRKLYFVYIIVDLNHTATWKLIPIT